MLLAGPSSCKSDVFSFHAANITPQAEGNTQRWSDEGGDTCEAAQTSP